MPLEFRDAWFFQSLLVSQCGEEVGIEGSREFRGVPSCFMYLIFCILWEFDILGGGVGWGLLTGERLPLPEPVHS